ncbi:MAG: metallopeptidase family protein [Minisyncoccia bacterium]
MDRKEFEKTVVKGIDAIPKRFLEKLNNVAIVVENRPTLSQKRKLKIRKGWTLFGLYEGVPQTARGINYGGALPDKITIFQEPIEEAAKNENEIIKIVKNTVWHEIAHHFGMDEKDVRKSEEKREGRREQ